MSESEHTSSKEDFDEYQTNADEDEQMNLNNLTLSQCHEKIKILTVQRNEAYELLNKLMEEIKSRDNTIRELEGERDDLLKDNNRARRERNKTLNKSETAIADNGLKESLDERDDGMEELEDNCKSRIDNIPAAMAKEKAGYSPQCSKTSVEGHTQEDELLKDAMIAERKVTEYPRPRSSSLTCDQSVKKPAEIPMRNERLKGRIQLKDAKWETRYNELCSYKRDHGHCNVPAKYDKNPQLGGWVHNQRTFNKNNTLREDRKARLNELGFVWVGGSLDSKWDKRYNELKEYRRLKGDCYVPIDFEANPQLGRWVHTQRTFYKKGKLSNERISKLNELEFAYSIDAKWDQRFNELKEYRRLRGDCNVPSVCKFNPQLGWWVHHQRTSYKNGKLSNERISKLDELKFAWNPSMKSV